MAKLVDKNVEDYIMPLNMNGLEGRMLHLPPPRGKKRDILFVYGQHSTLERWWGLIQELNRYGSVTVPDLPGYGGMDSLYKIGKSPTFDELADYLAAFVKLRYKRGKITIVGLSIGFAIVTRMLQRYPDLAKRVDLLVSVVGLVHHDDFILSKSRQAFYRYASGFFVHRPFTWFYKYVIINPVILRLAYHKTLNNPKKFEGMTAEEFTQTMEIEIHLWHINDLRTWMRSVIEMLRVDNCKVRVDLPVWHVSAKADMYFDRHMIEQHCRVVFSEYHHIQSNADHHGPSVIGDRKSAAAMIPPELRRVFNRP